MLDIKIKGFWCAEKTNERLKTFLAILFITFVLYDLLVNTPDYEPPGALNGNQHITERALKSE
jgi:hypothetical protein